MEDANTYKDFEAGSQKIVEKLVEDHMGWACSIARSVARAWNLDWQLDGLDGGAYEGLLFCARRYDPAMGVPFRAYARRRIHEAATEEARKSKSWKRAVGASGPDDQNSRELSARLLDVFPELRDGLLPSADGDGEEALRASIRQLLSSASVLHAFQDRGIDNPETAVEYKQMLGAIAELEPVHQAMVYGIYWKDQSMRGLAEEWGIDELIIVREHREILTYIHASISEGAKKAKKKLRVRPGLRTVAQQLRKKDEAPPFARFVDSAASAALCFATFISNISSWFTVVLLCSILS